MSRNLFTLLAASGADRNAVLVAKKRLRKPYQDLSASG